MMSAALTNDRFCLEISVAGYEFPNMIEDYEDANWLVIRVALRSVYGAWCWQVEDAGALTWELEGCIQWLRNLSAGTPVAEESYGFSEPDIRFETIRNERGEMAGLAVNLMDEFQPPTKVLVPRQNNIVALRFHTPPEVLRSFAEALAESLTHFPRRGTPPAN
ncbi:MAG TPA: hypothetical protein VHO69_03130 [Phototrophicaceae bacterium]|nr:hypothetical protein [Phototrophicaceae bacterium]